MAKTRKRPMKKLETKAQRSVSFTKRRYGLFNKAAELFMLCDTQLAVLVSSPCSERNRKIYYSFGHPSVDVVLNSFLENHVPNYAIDIRDKQYALSLMNEIKGLESDIGSISTQRNMKLDNLASGFSSIFDFFEKFESVEELQAAVGGLVKLVDKAKSRDSNSVSCMPSNDPNGDGVVESLQFGDCSSSSLLTADGFCTLNQTDCVSCSDINGASPTSKTDSNDLLTLQDSAFGYNFGSNYVFPKSIPVSNNIVNNLLELPESISSSDYNDNDLCLALTSSDSSLVDLDVAAEDCYYNECCSDIGPIGTLDNAHQNVRAANDYEEVLNWLLS